MHAKNVLACQASLAERHLKMLVLIMQHKKVLSGNKKSCLATVTHFTQIVAIEGFGCTSFDVLFFFFYFCFRQFKRISQKCFLVSSIKLIDFYK
jgi:hypothetical protein